MVEIALGVALFTAIIVALAMLILFARSKLVATGNITILVNNEKTLSAPAGDKLLNLLSAQRIFLPSACGGGGTCGQCKVKVLKNLTSINARLQKECD